MASAIYFFYLSGAKKGKIERAQAAVVRLGRQPYCEVALDPHQDLPASGEHAHVQQEPDGTFTLHDKGSTWGTYKNDVRIHGPVPLTTGDVVTLGIDEEGRQGPRLKFYLEKDILRCASCEGPVYKRHFKCPDCRRKTCLRCIDFSRKVCKPCGARRAAATGAYEVVEDDDVAAKAPARVVVSGKDAERVRRARSKQKLAGDGDAPGSDSSRQREGLADSARRPGTDRLADSSRQRQRLADSARRRDTARLDDSNRQRQRLADSARRRDTARLDDGRRRAMLGRDADRAQERGRPAAGRGASDEAGDGARAGLPDGVVAEPVADRPGFCASHEEFGTEPELAVPDLGAAVRRTPAASAADALLIPDLDDLDDGLEEEAPPAAPIQRPLADEPIVLARPDPSPHRPPPELRAEPVRGHILPPANKISAHRPAAIPCEGCAAPLDSSSFFICERCRARLCGRHRATASMCERCASRAGGAPPRAVSLPPPPPLPQQPSAIPPTLRFGRPPPVDGRPQWGGGGPREPLLETADESADELSNALGGGAPAEFASVRFECPHCEEPLAATARRCGHCGRDL